MSPKKVHPVAVFTIAGTFLILLLAVLNLTRNAKTDTQQSRPDRTHSSGVPQTWAGVIQRFKTTGVIRRYDPDKRAAYVSPEAWTKLDVEGKAALGYSLYEERRAATGNGYIEIYDFMTGKLLGAYKEDGLHIAL